MQKPIWRNMGPLAFAREPQEHTPSYPTTISEREKIYIEGREGQPPRKQLSCTEHIHTNHTGPAGGRMDFQGVLSFQLGKMSHHFWLDFYGQCKGTPVNRTETLAPPMY